MSCTGWASKHRNGEKKFSKVEHLEKWQKTRVCLEIKKSSSKQQNWLIWASISSISPYIDHGMEHYVTIGQTDALLVVIQFSSWSLDKVL